MQRSPRALREAQAGSGVAAALAVCQKIIGPYITPGTASTAISKHVHDDYAQNRCSFQGWLTSAFVAQSICDFDRDMLVHDLHMKSTVVISEYAAWTLPLDEQLLACLPPAGLKVLDHVRFNHDTTDFTPIFNKIEGADVAPDVITTGISHVGVQPQSNGTISA